MVMSFSTYVIRNTVASLVLLLITRVSCAVNYNSLQSGDYRFCLDQFDKKVNTFEVLPIYGWDNLRNLAAGIVIAANYSRCKLTPDGKYLIPDDVYLMPLKVTKMQQFAELIMHWHNYSSSTAKSINIEGGLQFHGFGISGKFSDSYESAKSKQVMDKSFMTRVQIRYIGYKAKLQPNANLHPSFKKALLKIAASLQMNQTNEARYLSELLVRDYGTHVVTSIDAGAALIQEDFVHQSLTKESNFNKHDVLAAASANFLNIVHFSVSHTSSKKNSMSDSYEKSKTSSNIISYGGSIYSFANFTSENWIMKLDNDLVAMDRSGDPLYFIINTNTLPELPSAIAQQLNEQVRGAIKRYYEYNTYRGCMDMDSPNFSFQANVDDGTCNPSLTNLTLGGVYQLCEGTLCEGLNQPNPKTGAYSCPSHYTSTKLHSEDFQKTYSHRECHGCGWWRKCCSSWTTTSHATLTSFWCAAGDKVPQESGYLFGGLYSSHLDNPMTEGKSCPESYSTRMIGSDLKICISDDYEEGSAASLPFGGFFSCKSGNPLAETPTKSPQSLKKSPLLTLKQYYRQTNSYSGPKGCPKGFSQHLAIVDQDCAIHYCIIAGALSAKGLPPVKRPPFFENPKLAPFNDEVYIFNINNGTWTPDEDAMKLINPANLIHPIEPRQSDGDRDSVSPGLAAGIAVCVTLACVAVLAGAVTFFRSRRRNRQTHGDIGPEVPFVRQQTDYGATPDNTTQTTED